MYVRSCPPLWVITRCSEVSHEGAALAHTRTLILRCIGHHQHAPPRKYPVHGSKDTSRTPTTAKGASAAQLRISARPRAARREHTSRTRAFTRRNTATGTARATVKQATDPEPSVYAEQWHPRPARARSRLDGVRTTRPPPTPSPRRSQVGGATQRRQRISAPSPHYVRVGERGPSS